MPTIRKCATLNTLHAAAPPGKYAHGASVIAYQEVDDARDRLARWEADFDRLDGWEQYVHHDVAAGAIRITWDAAVWEFVEGGGRRTHNGLAKVTPHRYIVWVVLRDRATGRLVRWVATHLISGVRGNGKDPVAWRRARSAEHLTTLSGLVDGWHAAGEDVVVLGDFNLPPSDVNLAPLRLAARSQANGGIDQVWSNLPAEDPAIGIDHGSDHRLVAVEVDLDDQPAPTPTPDPEAPVKRLPANLPDLLRAEGLNVVEVDGWQTRGRPASTGDFTPVGVLWHHTGAYDGLNDAQSDRAYADWLFKTGRTDLPAPLCQLSISAEGTVYVGAAGRANHAGKAKSSGTVAAGDGNRLYVGVECMNSGKQGWGRPQYDAMVTTGVVLARLLGTSVQTQRGHRETSVTGKWDPGMLDMDKFRADIDAALDGPKPRQGLPSPRERMADRIEHEADLAEKAGAVREAELGRAAARDLRDGTTKVAAS